MGTPREGDRTRGTNSKKKKRKEKEERDANTAVYARIRQEKRRGSLKVRPR